MKPVSLVLQEGRALIEDPTRWCHGTGVYGRRCAVTAVADCGSYDEWRRAANYLSDAAEATGDTAGHPWLCPAARYNDSHTHAEVMALYDIAISAALSDEASS